VKLLNYSHCVLLLCVLDEQRENLELRADVVPASLYSCATCSSLAVSGQSISVPLNAAMLVNTEPRLMEAFFCSVIKDGVKLDGSIGDVYTLAKANNYFIV